MKAITYLREGRKLRASGAVITTDYAGLTQVKPDRPGWGRIWVTTQEIEAGKEKPAYQSRPKPEAPQKRTRKPKAPAVPHWKQCVDRVRTYEADHESHGWPAVTTQFLTEMADELEGAHAKLAEFLPMGSR